MNSWLFSLAAAATGIATPTTVPLSIPAENTSKPTLEALRPYGAEALVKALNGEGDDATVNALFFPADAFQKVKGIADPAAYYRQLVKWFQADMTSERERLKSKGPWSVDSFKLGSCRWKEKGTEANALPYWSCYRSKLRLKNTQGDKELVDVRAVINWGTTWYITHLGAIPKHD